VEVTWSVNAARRTGVPDRRGIAAISRRSWKLGGCWSRSRGRVLQWDYCGVRMCVSVCAFIWMHVRTCAGEMPLLTVTTRRGNWIRRWIE